MSSSEFDPKVGSTASGNPKENITKISDNENAASHFGEAMLVRAGVNNLMASL
jgi:hypothetical protein